MDFAGGIDMAAKGNSTGCVPKIEPVDVVEPFTGGCGGDEKDFLAEGIERKTRIRPGRGVEIGFVEGEVTTGRDNRAVRKAEFPGMAQVCLLYTSDAADE